MNKGKEFEKDFKNSVPDNVYFYRIADTATGWSHNHEDTSSESNNIRFTPKNHFDCFIMLKGFPLELKSTQGTSFSFKGTSPMIKEHQIKELTKASKIIGVIPGFIFNFRSLKINKTYFLHINDFNKFTTQTTKSSINEKDIITYGGIEIESYLKRTKYGYRIDKLIERLLNND